MTLDWITAEGPGRKSGIKARQAQAPCADGKIEGAVKMGHAWRINKKTSRSIDDRIKVVKLTKTAISAAERIIGEVNGTMAIEGRPLTEDDKINLQLVLDGKVSAAEMVARLVKKHRSQTNVGQIQV